MHLRNGVQSIQPVGIVLVLHNTAQLPQLLHVITFCFSPVIVLYTTWWRCLTLSPFFPAPACDQFLL